MFVILLSVSRLKSKLIQIFRTENICYSKNLRAASAAS